MARARPAMRRAAVQAIVERGVWHIEKTAVCAGRFSRLAACAKGKRDIETVL